MEHNIAVKDVTDANEIFDVLTEFKEYKFLNILKNEEERRAYCEKIAKYANVAVAYYNGETVGCIAEYTNDSESGCAYITLVVVREDLGMLKSLIVMNLFMRMVDIADEKKLTTMKLEVAKDNKRAQMPPRNLGFKYVGDATPTSIYMEAPLEVAKTRIKILSEMLNRHTSEL